jgi:hypothetical protein
MVIVGGAQSFVATARALHAVKPSGDFMRIHEVTSLLSSTLSIQAA